MRKFMGRDKDSEFVYQLLPWAKQSRFGENEYIAN